MCAVRVVFLTHYFPPEAGAPQTRIAALTAALAERSVRVTVHTGPPHYPAGRIAPPHRNRPLARERAGAVRIVRSPVLPAPNRGTVRRLADHASFAVGALATGVASGPADVVVAETPPLFLAAAGVPYARMKRAPLVLNVADRWPASAVALGALRDGIALRIAERLEAVAYAGAAAITVPTQTMQATLEAHEAARGKVVWMPPAVDLDRFEAAPPTPGGRPLRAVYVGTIGLAQGIGTLVEAARLAGPAVVEVTIAGDGAEGEEVRRAAERVANVRCIGPVVPAQVPELYGAADVGVVLLRALPLFDEALPTKLLEVFAAGRAAVVGARGESAGVVEKERAGVAVRPEDPAALAAAFRALALDPERVLRVSAAARAAAERSFSRSASASRWLELLTAVEGGRRLDESDRLHRASPGTAWRASAGRHHAG